jgi:chemotaxis protein methyltransferase CheR
MSIRATDFNYIRELVRDRAAIVLEPDKEYLVESRLTPLAQQEAFVSLAAMIDRLKASSFGDLHRKVVEAITTNETSFFREMRTFELLRKSILPALIASRHQQRSLNLWCAAASSGQEPYSVAMTLRENFPLLDSWRVTFIASDISREMIVRARAGRYNQLEVNRGLPAHLLVKYFTKDGPVWEIDPQLRRMVEFQEINLVEDWPSLPRLDVVFMRNVLIYLDVETKKKILARTRRLLDPSGYLFLGGAESTTALDDSFEPVSQGGATYFRIRSGFPAPLAPVGK